MANVEILPGKYITCSKEVEEALRDILQASYDKIESQKKEIVKLKLELAYKQMDKSVILVLEYKYHKLLQAAIALLDPDKDVALVSEIDSLLSSCTNSKCKAEK